MVFCFQIFQLRGKKITINFMSTVKPRKWLILGPVICKNCYFQVTVRTIICEVLHGHLRHLQGLRTLNTNRHLARSVTFKAVICKVLLYCYGEIKLLFFEKWKITMRWNKEKISFESFEIQFSWIFSIILW
jgi:hypothetical protein